jgi:ATP-dependent RNA helicase DHX36
VQGKEAMTGAILVFLPGWDDISTLKDTLLQSGSPFASNRYRVLPLHSLIAPNDQRCVFQKLPQGVRKIVLSTNVAETAITIEDVAFVINSGRMKEKSFDPYTGVSTLQGTFVSQASEKQRRGRAGRCQPGLCFHLYSRHRSSQLPVRPAAAA